MDEQRCSCGQMFTPNAPKQMKCNACRFARPSSQRRPSGVPNPVQWREIPGYEGRYEINTLGTIRSMIGNTFITPKPTTRGYKVRLVDSDGKKHDHFLQRLLLLTFRPVANADAFIAFCCTDNKHDLSLTNWRWERQAGECAAVYRLTPKDKTIIRQRIFSDATLAYEVLAQEYRVNVNTIYSIMAGRR